MALKETALVHGTVIRVSSREVTSTKTGKPVQHVFHSAVIVGDHSMIEVSVSDDQLADMRSYVGETITAQVELGTYRDDVQSSIIAILTVSAPLDLDPVPA